LAISTSFFKASPKYSFKPGIKDVPPDKITLWISFSLFTFSAKTEIT